jgi:excisionase family DNA binding protein
MRTELLVATPKTLPPPLAYSTYETCALLGFKRATLYRRIKTGELEAKKMGSKTIILRSSIDKFLANLPDLHG